MGIIATIDSLFAGRDIQRRSFEMGVAASAQRVLFLENEDSFSWNLIDRLPFAREQINIKSGREVANNHNILNRYDLLVIGPGPTDPIRAGLIAVVQAAAKLRLPTLGICLGHQAIGLAFNAKLIRVKPAHGLITQVCFSPSRSFAGLISEMTVMRYNSLALSNVVAPLRIIATTNDGLVMAIEHESLPIAGLQFHPDSYATLLGKEMLSAFFKSLL
ncbi:MAG: aminodeoxychorismate/anthranilate synthase component II [Deltaproteobacteria bacterium]|nr:aminodeoxychorismate/anthranilate synthase component II [Deltaproteobacteria bacterium]